MPTLYSPSFFNVQIRFAQQVARVSNISFEDALLYYTPIPLHFMGRPFQPTHPLWQEYLKGLGLATDKARWTYLFCGSHRGSDPQSPYGCFRYHYQENEQLIRIHFINEDTSGLGPLSKARMPARVEELTKMFKDIKKQHPAAQKVRGRSWLYNIEAYKRLFPANYSQSTRVIDDDFCGLVLWGQFLQRDGEIHKKLADTFISQCRQKHTLKELIACFPYPVLEPEGSISSFYDFYRI